MLEEAEHRVLAGKQPTGRFVSSQAVAALVAYLCGPRGADITGAALPWTADGRAARDVVVKALRVSSAA